MKDHHPILETRKTASEHNYTSEIVTVGISLQTDQSEPDIFWEVNSSGEEVKGHYFAKEEQVRDQPYIITSGVGRNLKAWVMGNEGFTAHFQKKQVCVGCTTEYS